MARSVEAPGYGTGFGGNRPFPEAKFACHPLPTHSTDRSIHVPGSFSDIRVLRNRFLGSRAALARAALARA